MGFGLGAKVLAPFGKKMYVRQACMYTFCVATTSYPNAPSSMRRYEATVVAERASGAIEIVYDEDGSEDTVGPSEAHKVKLLRAPSAEVHEAMLLMTLQRKVAAAKSGDFSLPAPNTLKVGIGQREPISIRGRVGFVYGILVHGPRSRMTIYQLIQREHWYSGLEAPEHATFTEAWLPSDKLQDYILISEDWIRNYAKGYLKIKATLWGRCGPLPLGMRRGKDFADWGTLHGVSAAVEPSGVITTRLLRLSWDSSLVTLAADDVDGVSTL